MVLDGQRNAATFSLDSTNGRILSKECQKESTIKSLCVAWTTPAADFSKASMDARSTPLQFSPSCFSPTSEHQLRRENELNELNGSHSWTGKETSICWVGSWNKQDSKSCELCLAIPDSNWDAKGVFWSSLPLNCVQKVAVEEREREGVSCKVECLQLASAKFSIPRWQPTTRGMFFFSCAHHSATPRLKYVVFKISFPVFQPTSMASICQPEDLRANETVPKWCRFNPRTKNQESSRRRGGDGASAWGEEVHSFSSCLGRPDIVSKGDLEADHPKANDVE